MRYIYFVMIVIARACHQLWRDPHITARIPDSQEWFCVIHRRSAESEGLTYDPALCSAR